MNVIGIIGTTDNSKLMKNVINLYDKKSGYVCYCKSHVPTIIIPCIIKKTMFMC